MLVMKSIAQLVLVINRARLRDVVLGYRFAHRFDIRVSFIARHVNSDDAQTCIVPIVAPLADARHVLFTDAATDRPEMHERPSSLRFRFGMCLRRAEPLGRAVKFRHLRPNSHWHSKTSVKSE